MKLYVTRHGETPYNVENRICGISDISLNEHGKKQAQIIGEKLSQYHIDYIIASPLKRAQETANIISHQIKVPVITDERLHEINFGIFEGMPGKNEDFRYVKKNHAIAYPQGEKLFQVVQRVYNFLDEIHETYAKQNVLIVCHGGIVRIIHSYYHDMSNEELFSWLPENCCFQEYEK